MSTANVPSPSLPAHTGSGGGRGKLVLIGTIAVLGILLAVGLIPRLMLQPKLTKAAQAEKTDLPIVTVVQPTHAPSQANLELPGNIEGEEQTAINARASGYIQQWFVDIGDKVKAGQTLALISAPDADLQTAQARAQVANSAAAVQQAQANVSNMQANAQQAQANESRAEASLQQARTDLAHAQAAVAQALQTTDQQRAQIKQAQANLDLAKVTAERYTGLAREGAVAQQTADQEVANYKTNLANVQALQAALRAGEANVAQARAAVLSSEANVKAYADGVRAARAAVAAAQANVQASRANTSASVATLAANNANYQRNAVLQAYQKVVAPFDGIITARNVDVGTLVSAGGGASSSASPSTGGSASSAASGSTGGVAPSGGLFTLVRSDRVRTFVSLPQNFVGSVQAGQMAQVFVQELGNKPFTGRIVRSTQVLDPATRTLRTEIQLDNPNGVLRPGMFATVKVVLPQSPAVRIPDTALINDANGTQVAIVTTGNKIHLQTVTVGTDYGKEMDITQGLTGSETLVGNPTPNLQEGMAVQIQQPPANQKNGENRGGGNGGRQGQSHRGQ